MKDKKKGLFVVDEYINFHPNSGAYKHVQVAYNELSKYYDLIWNKKSEYKEQEHKTVKLQKPFFSRFTTKSKIKDTLFDIKVIIGESLSIPSKIIYLLQNKIDFIYQRTHYLGFSWLIASKLTKTPIFIEVNGIFSQDIRRYRVSYFNGLVFRIEKFIYKNVTHGFYVGGINESVGYFGDNATIIQNGISKSVTSIIETQKETNSVIRLVFLGHIMEHHKLDFLILGLNKVRKPNMYELHIIGKENPNIQLPKSSKVKVQFYGSKNDEQLKTLLPNFDFGIVPFAKNYYSNMKLFIYVIHNLPVIIPNSKNFNRVFDKESAFFFNNEDESDLVRLLDALPSIKKDKLDSVSQKALDIVIRNYTWEKIFTEKVDIINREIVTIQPLRAKRDFGKRHF